MKLNVFYFLLIITILLSACHHHDEPEPAKTPVTRTVIVYVMAENSLCDYVSQDSIEMAAATNRIPEDVNFVLYKDDRSKPVIYTLSKKNGVKKWKGYKEDLDSADSTVMRSTLQEIVRAFPAEHYGLVLWSHGSGWVPRRRKTIGMDNNRNTDSNYGTTMEISELEWALKDVAHFDYIFFDACFMQSIEVAYQLRHVTDATVGSPAEIPGNGAPYHLIMESLCKGDVQQMTELYYSAYTRGEGVTLSAINCLKLDSFALRTAPLIQKTWKDKASLSYSGIQYYGPFISERFWNPEPYDMRSAMHHLLSEEDFATWNEALQDIVIEQRATQYWTSVYCRYGWYDNYLSDPDHYSGISMFIPQSKYENYGWNEAFQKSEWYKAAGWEETGW